MCRHALLLILFLLAGHYTYAQSSDTAKVQMDEVVISAKTSVRVNKDTVTYTVDSFNKNPLSTAEDVLKKLPGVEIASDGTITIQGKKVEKIFINGKEYDAGDLRTLTQNIPAEVLEHIQIADWYDEQTQFTGLRKNSDQKSINLKFKKKYSDGLYGRAGAGYGTKDRYQAGLFANYMSDGYTLTTIGNINNTGVSDATNSNTDNIKSPTSNIPGVNQRKNLNINFSLSPKDAKLKLRGSYDVSTNKTEIEQSLTRNTYLPGDSSLIRRNATTQNNNSAQHRIGLNSRYKVNNKLNMITDLKLGFRNNDISANGNDRTYYNTTDSLNFQRTTATTATTTAPSVSFSHTIQKGFNKKGRTLSIQLNGTYNNNDRQGTNDNINEYRSPFAINSTQFSSTEVKNDLNTRIHLQYTEPLDSNHSISLNYTNLLTISDNDRDVVNRQTEQLDTTQTVYYENRNNENPFGITYQYQSAKVTGGGGVNVQPYSRRSNTVRTVAIPVQQTGINYFPSAFMRVQASKQANINFNYNGSIVSPDIKQLQPVPDYTDSLNIYVGNPNLRPEANNNIALAYNYFNTRKQTLLWANLRGNWTNGKIVSKTDVNATRRITTPQNVNGAYNLSASLNYTFPVFRKNIKFTFAMQSNKSRNVTITNGSLQYVDNYNLQPSGRLMLTFDNVYEGEVSYNYSSGSFSNATTNNLLQTHTIGSNGTFSLPWALKLGYYINYIVTTGYDQGFDNNFVQANLLLDKTFTNPKGLSIRLQAFDIFNSYPNVNRTFGDNYYEDRAVMRLGSYFMASLIYKFNYFPARGGAATDQ